MQSWSVQTDFRRWPWENTIVYYTLNSISKVADMSWNSRNWTQSWTVRFWQYWWVDCMDLTSIWEIILPTVNVPNTYTILIRANNISWYDTSDWKVLDFRTQNPPSTTIVFNSSNQYMFTDWTDRKFNAWQRNKRYLLVITVNWTARNAYMKSDNTNIHLNWTWTPVSNVTVSQWNFRLWNEYNAWATRHFKWYLSKFIFEDFVRPETEIDKFYEKEKSAYWY